MLTCDNILIEQDAFSLTADVGFATGKTTALIGPSGAGKSTILAAMAGFLVPKHGRVLWRETDLTHLAPGERPISTLFQDNNLFPHLTAAQNVGLALRPDLKLSPQQAEQVEQALSDVGLAGLGPRKPASLSGGQQSRVALARVLVADRAIVLLDEPFSALGPAMKDEMLDLVSDKLTAAGKTIIMVTHDPSDARRIADQVSVVADNTVGPPQPTADAFQQPSQALRDYLGDI